jgi:MscS family membrane protein
MNLTTEIILTLAAVLIYVLGRAVIRQLVRRYARRIGIDRIRTTYITKMLNFILFVVLLTALALVWNFKIKNLGLYFASFFTVAGVALFAGWSILSNITASAVLFFSHPIRIGYKVKILDGENTIIGHVSDITLFSIIMKTEEGHIASFPNNMALQKGIVILESNRLM